MILLNLMKNFLLTIGPLIEGTVVKRPSQYIKTPYVADVVPIIGDGNSVLAHSAALGCCGLADTGAKVLMEPVPDKPIKSGEKKSCAYKIYLSILKEKDSEIIVGIHPTLAERLAEAAIEKNMLTCLQDVQNLKKQTTINNSRFDFTGIDRNGAPFIMEVKNVPLADYEDDPVMRNKKRKFNPYQDRAIDSKVAYFPEGYRKKKGDVVSPRALKHIQELTTIKRMNPETRCLSCFVIQRSDVNRFQISFGDPAYRMAVKEAIEAGVEVIPLVVRWTKEGEAIFIRDDLPITSFDEPSVEDRVTVVDNLEPPPVALQKTTPSRKRKNKSNE
jgi:DNA-binding sugar fermentation-stimulating protein